MVDVQLMVDVSAEMEIQTTDAIQQASSAAMRLCLPNHQVHLSHAPKQMVILMIRKRKQCN